MSTEFGNLMEELGAEHSTSASGVSQQNGKSEKAVQDSQGPVNLPAQDWSRPTTLG